MVKSIMCIVCNRVGHVTDWKLESWLMVLIPLWNNVKITTFHTRLQWQWIYKRGHSDKCKHTSCWSIKLDSATLCGQWNGSCVLCHTVLSALCTDTFKLMMINISSLCVQYHANPFVGGLHCRHNFICKVSTI